MQKKIYLIDGNSFIYRMFFALPEFSTKDGRVVNATFGMAKFFMEQLVKEKPDYVVFIKDAKGTNFRHDLYSEYKATRERMPETLRSQIGDIEEMITRMGMRIIEIAGFEADDVIGTLATRLSQECNNEIYILSGDKDLYALVSEQVKVYDTQRKKISWPEETFEKFWVPASCVRDYLAICGDTSDNIPGISGIWPVKAQVLLNYFWSLEKIYEAIDSLWVSSPLVGDQGELSRAQERDSLGRNWEGLWSFPEEVQKLLKWKTLEKFIEGRELAFLSQKLATLACDMELPWFDIEDYVFSSERIQTPEVFSFFQELEFFSLLKNTPSTRKKWTDLWKKIQIIWDEQGLHDLKKKILWCTRIVLDTETTSLDVREAELVGVSILLWEDDIFYINLLHTWPQVSPTQVQDFLKQLLQSELEIIGHNLKYDLQIIQIFLEKDFSQNQAKNDKTFWQTTLWI